MNKLTKKWFLTENKNQIIYNAFVLTDSSISKLKNIFPPVHTNLYYHHVTINFGVKEYPKNLGDMVTAYVIGYAEDENGQAVVVNGIESKNKYPHITLSCAEGIKPVYSNVLLNKGFDSVDKIEVYGVIKSYTNSGWIS